MTAVTARGSTHQGDAVFEYGGRQCTSNAVTSICYHFSHLSVTQWTTKDIDVILQEGDRNFSRCIKDNAHFYLMPTDINQIVLLAKSIDLVYPESRMGSINTPCGDSHYFSLSDALNGIDSCVLTFGSMSLSYAVGIIKEGSAFFCFDSHKRGPDGLCCADGVASLTRCESADDLVEFIKKLSESVCLPECMFEVVRTEVRVRDCECEFEDDDAELLKTILSLEQNREQPNDIGSYTNDIESCAADLQHDFLMNETDSEGDDNSLIYPEPKFTQESANYDSDTPLSKVKTALDRRNHVSTAKGEANDNNDEQKYSSCQQNDNSSESDKDDSVDEGISFTCGHSGEGSSFSSHNTSYEQKTDKRQSRKRTRNVDDWKVNQRKRLRNSGAEYVTRKGHVMREKVMRLGCGFKCRKKCKSKITENEREDIFHHFWKMGCLTKQRNYICKVVKKIQKKTEKKGGVSRRDNTYEYTFDINGKQIKVCKKMFLDTLDIGDTVVATAISKSTCIGTCNEERRGKQCRKGNSKETEKEEIRKHINSFPRMESHYARKDTKKEYLEGNLNIQKMYEMYVELRKQSGCNNPASETTYRFIFNYEFNISFHKRMKDRCDLCAGYENCKEKDESMEQNYKEHIQLKEESRRYKEEIKRRLQQDQTLAAAVFDLEEVLPTPSSDESCLYYKRKLNTYNLTVYDYRSGQGYCYVWPETEACRGSNEIASCVYSFLQTIKEKGAKKVILFSDSCGGQNRNKNFLTMLWYSLQKLQFNVIEHVFFVSGHSQNEGDSMHSVIERSSKNVPVYTPSQWAQLIRTAKRQPPKYIVKEFNQSNFVNFKRVADKVKNFQLDATNGRVKWLKIKKFVLSSEKKNTIGVHYDYSSEGCELNLFKTMRNEYTPLDVSKIKLQIVSKNQYPLTREKYLDLTSLCDKNIIPETHHKYYRSLPHVE